MARDPLVVVSTGLRARTAERCRDSVRGQTADTRHVYVEAGLQSPPLASLHNLWRNVVMLPMHSVVVWLDGDDWLAHPQALERVLLEYEDPDTWMTYGSFAHDGGGRGSASRYPDPRACRSDEWRGTHLRTFRARLFQRVRQRDLQRGGEWVSHATDMAVMFPMLEMAGGHARFIPDILCIYAGRGMPASERERELEAERFLRSKPSYRRVEAL